MLSGAIRIKNTIKKSGWGRPRNRSPVILDCIQDCPKSKAETDYKREDIDDRDNEEYTERQKSNSIELPFLSAPLHVSEDDPPQA